MAITFTALPNRLLEPVYSPFYFVTNSTLNISGNTNFKYVYKVQQLNQPSLTVGTTLATIKLFARPDGSGIFSPARILENTLSYDAQNFYLTNFNNASNSIAFYKITFGEEYNPSGVTYSSVTNNSGYAQFNFNSVPTLSVGDIITIKQTNPFYNPSYEGQQTITSISGTTGVVTNKSFGSPANDSGTCEYRLTYYSNNTFTGTCINFAKQYRERNKDFIAENVVGNPNAGWLTTYEGETTIQPENVYMLSAFQTANTTASAVILTYDRNNLTNGIYVVSKVASPYQRFDFGAGTYELARTSSLNALTSTIQPIYNSSVVRYSVILADSGLTAVASAMTFNVKSCGNDWNNIRLAFLNRRGGFSFQNFNLKRKRKLDLDRTIISKPLNYNYSIGDIQEFQIDINQKEELELNTDWLNQSEGDYLEELFTSPVVFYLNNDLQEYYPFIITSKEFEQMLEENESLIQYQIMGHFGYTTNFQRN